MSAKKLLWLPLGAAAVLFATCTPSDQRGGSDTSPAPRAEATPPEQIVKLPMPRPSGPRWRIEAAIENVRRRDLLTTNGFWTVFHGILGLGPGVQLRNPDTDERVNAVEYIAGGGELRGLRFLPTRHGLDVQIGPTAVGQGHQDQFVAEMGQWGMPANKKFVVLGRDYTFLDFVNHSQMRARINASQELSWAIILVAQYKGLDVVWTNAYGERLRLEDLVRYESDASVEQAPCGGTHRLFGLTWVYHMHRQRGGKAEGVWKDIADKTAKYRDLARKYQNPDGAFSTAHFRGPGNAADKQARISTSGHILEWLALALSDEELKQQWVEDGANAVALMILDLQDAPIDGGALYHAVHGLLIYHARMYGRHTVAPPELLYPQPGDRPPLSLAPSEHAVKLD
jgi:hypothetical protein